MNIIAFMNEAGGVGKSTLAFSVACAFSESSRVLLVDFDGQRGNLTSFAGIRKPDGLLTMYNILKEGVNVHDCIKPIRKNLDIIPADDTVAGITGDSGAFSAFYSLIEAVSDYDYMILDIPPAPGPTHVLTAVYADYVIIPCLPDGKSIESVKGTLETLSESHARVGIVFNRFDGRTNLARAAVTSAEAIADGAGAVVFDSKIRAGVSVAESMLEHTSVQDYDKRSKVTGDILAFIGEVKGWIK